MKIREFREVIASIDKSLSDLEHDVAESAAAQTEMSKNLQTTNELIRAQNALLVRLCLYLGVKPSELEERYAEWGT